MTPWIVIPARGVRAGKSRLATRLSEPGRHALNTMLLRHVLAQVREVQGTLDACLVVSPCAETLGLAAHAGARTLAEPKASGLNPALEAARREVIEAGATRLLILPTDLPSLNATALGDFIELARAPGRLVIAPDALDAGTNALAVDGDSRFASFESFVFRFGEHSFRMHLEQARRLEIPSVVHRASAFAYDLDTPEDFDRFERNCGFETATLR